MTVRALLCFTIGCRNDRTHGSRYCADCGGGVFHSSDADVPAGLAPGYYRGRRLDDREIATRGPFPTRREALSAAAAPDRDPMDVRGFQGGYLPPDVAEAVVAHRKTVAAGRSVCAACGWLDDVSDRPACPWCGGTGFFQTVGLNERMNDEKGRKR